MLKTAQFHWDFGIGPIRTGMEFSLVLSPPCSIPAKPRPHIPLPVDKAIPFIADQIQYVLGNRNVLASKGPERGLRRRGPILVMPSFKTPFLRGMHPIQPSGSQYIEAVLAIMGEQSIIFALFLLRKASHDPLEFYQGGKTALPWCRGPQILGKRSFSLLSVLKVGKRLPNSLLQKDLRRIIPDLLKPLKEHSLEFKADLWGSNDRAN